MFSADCTFKRSGGITCAAPSMVKGKVYWEPGLANHASHAGVLLISVETRNMFVCKKCFLVSDFYLIQDLK